MHWGCLEDTVHWGPVEDTMHWGPVEGNALRSCGRHSALRSCGRHSALRSCGRQCIEVLWKAVHWGPVEGNALRSCGRHSALRSCGRQCIEVLWKTMHWGPVEDTLQLPEWPRAKQPSEWERESQWLTGAISLDVAGCGSPLCQFALGPHTSMLWPCLCNDCVTSSPAVFREPVIFFGASITHPPVGDKYKPTIGAVSPAHPSRGRVPESAWRVTDAHAVPQSSV